VQERVLFVLAVFSSVMVFGFEGLKKGCRFVDWRLAAAYQR
jgi:hypothetical protein